MVGIRGKWTRRLSLALASALLAITVSTGAGTWALAQETTKPDSVASVTDEAGGGKAKSPPELTLSPEQEALVGIEVAPLSERAATEGVAFPSRVVIPPHQISDVSAALAVKIESIAVQVDQYVKKGALLARAESPALIRAQSEFLQAVDQQKFLQETLTREKSLIDDHVLSLKQLQNTRNEYSKATARTAEQRQMLRDYGMTDEAIATLLADRILTSKTSISSPIDGVVLKIMVTPGQRIEMQNPMFRIAQLNPLWLELQVPVEQIARFTVGLRVTVPDVGVSGHVIAIGSTADRMTQGVTVRVEVTEHADRLKPGQFVQALVNLATGSKQAWTVSPEAVIRRDKETFVFVKTKTGFRPQPVTVIEELPDAVVISGPLKPGEEIAVHGLAALKGAWQGLGGSE